jgi:predicted negative regulator of RcsB-dependent stress response
LLAQSHDELLKGDFLVSRSNILFLIIGALVIAVAVMGYELYQDRKQPEGMRIDVGPNGLKIEKK